MCIRDRIRDDAKWHEAFLSLRQVQYYRDYLLAFDDPLKNDLEENISWEYAKSVSDVKFLPKDPNTREEFYEDKIGMVCDLVMGYQVETLSADKLGEGGKIRLVSTNNPEGRDLKISLEVVCVAQQIRKGEG